MQRLSTAVLSVVGFHSARLLCVRRYVRLRSPMPAMVVVGGWVSNGKTRDFEICKSSSDRLGLVLDKVERMQDAC